MKFTEEEIDAAIRAASSAKLGDVVVELQTGLKGTIVGFAGGVPVYLTHPTPQQKADGEKARRAIKRLAKHIRKGT